MSDELTPIEREMCDGLARFSDQLNRGDIVWPTVSLAPRMINAEPFGFPPGTVKLVESKVEPRSWWRRLLGWLGFRQTCTAIHTFEYKADGWDDPKKGRAG